MHNFKRAIAESYFGLGMQGKGDKEFEKIIQEYPNNVYSYIGWGDMYGFYTLNKSIKKDSAKAEKLYKMAHHADINKKDIALVKERIEDLEKERKDSVK